MTDPLATAKQEGRPFLEITKEHNRSVFVFHSNSRDVIRMPSFFPILALHGHVPGPALDELGLLCLRPNIGAVRWVRTEPGDIWKERRALHLVEELAEKGCFRGHALGCLVVQDGHVCFGCRAKQIVGNT